MKRVGLFFGTFNPIHVGHLIIADYVAQAELVDQVWLVVTPQNPHKKKSSLLADYHRLAIVRSAVEDNNRLQASNIEFDLEKPSYTVKTLAYLKEKYQDTDFALIMGEDNLRTFHKWRNHEEIVANHDLLVYPRIRTESEPQEENYPYRDHPRVSRVDAPVMQLSSTLIRQKIKAGKDVRYLLSEPVHKYVREMHFYEK